MLRILMNKNAILYVSASLSGLVRIYALALSTEKHLLIDTQCDIRNIIERLEYSKVAITKF